eukprot:10431517-Karenia_brevis.AAC.1
MALVLSTIANGIVPCDDQFLGDGPYNHAMTLKEHRQTLLSMRRCPIYQVSADAPPLPDIVPEMERAPSRSPIPPQPRRN